MCRLPVQVDQVEVAAQVEVEMTNRFWKSLWGIRGDSDPIKKPL